MKSKHSSGKWIVRKTVDNSGDYPFPTYDVLSIHDYGPEGIACAYQNPYNARLMAGSPEMLKALIECYSYIESNTHLIELTERVKEILEEVTNLKIEELIEE